MAVALSLPDSATAVRTKRWAGVRSDMESVLRYTLRVPKLLNRQYSENMSWLLTVETTRFRPPWLPSYAFPCRPHETKVVCPEFPSRIPLPMTQFPCPLRCRRAIRCRCVCILDMGEASWIVSLFSFGRRWQFLDCSIEIALGLIGFMNSLPMELAVFHFSQFDCYLMGDLACVI